MRKKMNRKLQKVVVLILFLCGITAIAYPIVVSENVVLAIPAGQLDTSSKNAEPLDAGYHTNEYKD